MKRSLFSFVCTVLLLSLTCSVRAASTYGVLINSNRLVAAEDAGESVDGHTQYLARVQLNALDTIRLIDTSNNNATWMVDLDAASVSGFEGSATLGYMVCMTAGCYDCYIKLKYQSDQLYIGAGTDDCSEGVEYNPSAGGGGDTQEMYYLVGNSADMGEWSLENALLLTDGTITLDLQEGEYKFKVVEGRSWDVALGYTDLNFDCSSYNVRGDEDGNINVVLAQAGTFTVAVQNGQLCVTGSFVNNTDQVRLTTGVSPEGSGYISPASGTYSLGSSVELSASISTGGWMFDRWSDDNSWGNPRTVTLTQDTTITAIFSPGEYGLLINGSTIVDGTFTGRVPEGSYIGQFKATTYLQQGDQLQIINLFHGDNSAWRPEIEDGGLSSNFEIGDNNLTCNVAGCYDIYIKIHYGQSSDVVYIGEGYDCPNQGDTSGGNTDGDVLFSTSFEDWPSQTYSSEQTWAASNIIFTLNRVKVVSNQQPASVSGSSVGYIQPTNTSSAYVYTDRLAYVERVVYTHASAISGGGWQLQSSSDGTNWYAFNENEPGCATSYQAEQKEVYVFMENVWLRWVPMGGSTNTNIYLTDIIIYGNNGSSGAPGIVASGDCAEDGSSNVTWLLSTDSILTIGGNGRMADYDEQTNIAPWYQYKDAYNSVYIADGVTNVGNLAFRESPNLRYVDLASTVTQLGNYSFYNCPTLHSLTLPESVAVLSENTPFGGTTKMNSAVYNSRVFVSLPQDYSGEFAVADGTIMVASQAFRGCSQLTAVALPNTVTNLLGSSTFENCTSLMSVILPDGIIDLGQYAFSGCITLKGIDLPSTLASLGSYCFAECSAVDSIICRATTPPSANGSTFAGVPEGTTVYVPGESIETYLAADGWSTFSTYLALDQSAGNTCPVSGTCGADGDNITWELGCDSVLTLTGTGAMADYSLDNAPWYESYRQAIRSVVIGSGITSVGARAFTDCTSLTSVDFGETVTSVGYYAFGFCSSLQHVTLPNSITAISNGAFDRCPLTEPLYNSHVFVFMPETYAGEYSIPEGIETIAGYAFKGCSQITSITVPESVTSISGGYAFSGCSSLQSINIPAGVTYIGGGTFSGCSSLRYIEIPASVTQIAVSAFSNCTGLDSITCNATYPPMAEANTFEGVATSIPVNIPAGTTGTYSQATGWNQFTNFRELPDSVCVVARGICGAQERNLSWVLTCDSVLTIFGTGAMVSTYYSTPAPWAEYGSKIRDIVIGEGVTNMAAYAFYNDGNTAGVYDNVRTLYIPSTMQNLVNNYFYRCPLDIVTINSDTIVGKGNFTSGSSINQLFGSRVRQFIIGDSVKSIANSAFYNQSPDSLESVILPEGLQSIGTWAFGYVEHLSTIALPSTLQTLDTEAFSASGLESIDIPAGLQTIGSSVFKNCKQLSSVTFHNGLKTIGVSAFQNCTALPVITIPETVETVNSGAFQGCTSLTKVTVLSALWAGENKSSSSTTKQVLDGYVRELVLGDGITRLGKYAFSGIDSLRTITFPSSLEVVGEYAFSNCKSLSSLSLPAGVTTIGNYAFTGCAAIDSVSLGESLVRIGQQAFSQCTSMRSLPLPESLRAINSTAFYGCTGLTEVVIPSAVDSLGSNIFGGCTNLTRVTVNSNALCSQTFTTTANIKTAFNQDAILTYVIGEGVTAIGNYAFYNSPMVALNLPSTLTAIGTGSFGSCSSLTCVTCEAVTPPTISASTAFSRQDTLLIPCEAKTLYKQAEYWQNFSKIICPDDMNTPTELTYTLTADWQFIMLPGVFGLSADDIVTDGDVVWATYNAERRAAGLSGWEIYSAATGFSGTKAFIVRAADANATLTIHIPDQAREPAGAALPLTYQAAAHPQNANWNFLGNPYPYEYNISAALLAQGIETPITVWNGTGYSTYTPGIDEYTLQPFQAFFIQLPDNGPETITFSSEYIAASGENDLLWDYTEAAPSANPDNGLYYASMVSDAVGTNNGLKGVKLNASGWAYFEKANVAGKLKLTFANRKVQTAYAVSVYNATKTEGENPVKGEKIADTDDVEFGSSATIALPAEVTGVYIERKTDAEGVLSKIEFKEGVAH